MWDMWHNVGNDTSEGGLPMPVSEPSINEYQRALLRAGTNGHNPPALPRPFRNIFSELPPFRQTAITEWGACLYAKTGDIKAKSVNGLVTFYSRHPILDWDWLQRILPGDGWIICPMCGLRLPHTAQYWWKDGVYLRKDKCRNCSCKTARRRH